MASPRIIEQERPKLVTMSPRDGLAVFGTGLIIGIVLCGLYVALDRYVFAPALCEHATGTLERCENKDTYAAAIATLLAGFGGVFAMVRLRVYRPLLVAILVTLALWGIVVPALALSWWMGTILVALLFGVGYAAFAWLARIRNFYVAFILSILLVVAVRLVLIS